MVKYMRYQIAYLDECDRDQVVEVEADDEADALATLERVAVAYVPVGVRLAA